MLQMRKCVCLCFHTLIAEAIFMNFQETVTSYKREGVSKATEKYILTNKLCFLTSFELRVSTLVNIETGEVSILRKFNGNCVSKYVSWVFQLYQFRFIHVLETILKKILTLFSRYCFNLLYCLFRYICARMFI